MASPFADASLREAIGKVLQEATIPTEHGFAAIVNKDGAQVALATRTRSGWQFDVSGGYNWTQHDPSVQLSIGKTW